MTDHAMRQWRLASPVTANVLGGFGVVVVAAVIWLNVLSHMGNLGQGTLNLLIYITLGAVGVVVARAQPRNPVGWPLIGGALALALSSAGGAYAVQVYPLAYAIVTGLLAGCFIGVVALGTDVLPFRGSVAVALGREQPPSRE